MTQPWPALPYEPWRATRDTLHAHAQLLGKLAVALAAPEPELQHAALRLTARGWETLPLPAPDGSGSFVAALDLRAHEAVLEFSDGRAARRALAPDRAVADVTNELLGDLTRLVGEVALNLRPQEVPWTVPLDKDREHRSYDPEQVDSYFRAAVLAGLVLAEVRAPYRGRSSPVNAWWGSFDLAVSLYSGRPAEPPSDSFIGRNSGDAQQVEVGWWPGDGRYPRAAFYGYAAPAPPDLAGSVLPPGPGRWDPAMGEFLLDWDDVIGGPDPRATALEFLRSVVDNACTACDWDSELAASARGAVPALR